MDQQTPAYYKWLKVLIGMAVLVNFSGLFNTIIGPDGTYYAGIAKTMVWRHNWVNLYVQGADFLDKPHFPFWVTALSFQIFGVQTWAYKLPGILFLMMGAVYTFLLARKLYPNNRELPLWAALILLTAEHIIISNNDVRAEPYLTGLITGSIYHFYNTSQRTRFGQLLLGALLAGLAIMTKGMFALIPIGGAIGGHLIITGQWRQVFHWRWLMAAVLIGLFILPEVYCLNVQFDTHPEKLIFGQHGVSGIKWFLWDSQIGRFFNKGPYKGSGDPFFFVHTLLWAFLPWSLLLYAALFWSIRKNYRTAKSYQWYCLCGSLLTFLVFSASQFQLPYYLNIVFPLFAIQLAEFLQTMQVPKNIRATAVVQRVVQWLLALLIAVLFYFFKPTTAPWWLGLIIPAVVLYFSLAKSFDWLSGNRKVVIQSAVVILLVNLSLNLVFYPSLMHYQSGSEAAFYINANNPQQLPVAQTGDNYNFPLEFYLNKPLITIDPNGHGTPPKTPCILYGDSQVIKVLAAQGWQIRSLKSFDQYWVSMLKPAFLNAQTRGTVVTQSDVVLVTRAGDGR